MSAAGPEDRRFDRGRIKLTAADITRLQVDAVVNAANSRLRPGGGVDGAIHRAAGPELAVECTGLGGCPTGEVRVTGGYRLPARYVIHAVGPVWQGGAAGEADLLAACYRNALAEARRLGIASMAFPAISCGVYGYPVAQAAAIAVQTVRRGLAENHSLTQVVFSCPDAAVYSAYREVLEAASAV